ncbi:MAG: SGNH/GDSL hydrolase family protein [Aquabacterium sp.]|uniref:SGNH/GDSL hydrolase family protein n=1 Tax=Aquabacterium sp. TaxID=1872578 RepID=UPI003BCEAC1E
MLHRLTHGLITLVLAPCLLAQGRWVRRMTPVLPEPDGPREGVIGRGRPLRVLILGDSSAAGVGAAHQDEALSGQLSRALAPCFAVQWSLQACTGHQIKDVMAAVRLLPPKPWDVVVVAVGVNDATGMTRLSAWLDGLSTLRTQLRQRHGASCLVWSALPPVHHFPALPQPLRWYLGRCARRLEQALRTWVARHDDCVVADVNFPMDLRYMATDGFHPGPLAYAAWGQALAELIAQRLAEWPRA